MSRPTPSPEVLCIGHAAYDLSVFLREFPGENTKAETETMLEGGGGPAANAAFLLSSWGVPCAFAGLLGDDHFGKRILADLKARGTNVSLVEVRRGHPTPLSFILVNLSNGSRTLINRKVKHSILQIDRTRLAAMCPRVLLFDGHELTAARLALKSFPKAIAILDAGSLRPGTVHLSGRVQYLVASERFGLQACRLKTLAHKTARRAAVRQLRERCGHTVVITLGERGLIGDDGRGYFELPAFKAKAVDTTGAGDIFHGAFTYGIARGMSLMDSLRLASMAASLSVERIGGRPSIPILREVIQALRNAA